MHKGQRGAGTTPTTSLADGRIAANACEGN